MDLINAWKVGHIKIFCVISERNFVQIYDKGKGQAVPLEAWRAQRVPGIKVPRLYDNSTGRW